jgi:hypothetical protein
LLYFTNSGFENFYLVLVGLFFCGSCWNISTNEAVLERLLNFRFFETYFIPHPVQAREPSKFKKLKIGVARKPDLIEPN